MSFSGVGLNYTQIYNASKSVEASKVLIPVSTGQVLYAQFRYVQGVAAGPGDSTISISHLKVMDSLIQALHTRGIKIPKVIEQSADPLKLVGHLKAEAQVPAPAPYRNQTPITGLVVDAKA